MTIDTIGNSTSMMQAQMAHMGMSDESQAAGAVSDVEAAQMATRNDQSRYMQIENGEQQGMLASYQGQNVDMMA
jgi:hypothetical protein